MTKRLHTLFSVVLTVVVLAALAWGVAVVGTPGSARLQRFDQRRLEDLQTIVREVQSLCQDPDSRSELRRALPATLDELAALARSERINLTDPATRERYGYTVKGGTSYEICATFALPRESDVDVFWNHSDGRHCFTIDALDPP